MTTTSMTAVHEMPPLHVTTVGIPPDEHITARETHRREHELWWGSDRIAWLALGVLVLMLVVVFVAALAQPRATGPGTVAWAEHRAGERATTYSAPVLSPQLASPFTGRAYAALPF